MNKTLKYKWQGRPSVNNIAVCGEENRSSWIGEGFKDTIKENFFEKAAYQKGYTVFQEVKIYKEQSIPKHSAKIIEIQR